jgi:membrane-bound lytic murein transglycosylase MltF
LATLDDLSGKTVWVMPGTRMQSDMAALNQRLRSAGKAAASVRAADPLLEPGDVLELVNTGVYPIALMQDIQAGFWAQVFPSIRLHKDLVLAEHVEIGWAIQKNTPHFKEFLDDFLRTHGLGTAFGNTVMLRYGKNAKYVRNATEENEMVKFRATQPHFRKYAARYDLDALLLAAQGYQESRLDQKVKSPVGAIGIMQVMPKTAASAPVKIANIQIEENNIHAGARLMHFLIQDYFDEPELEQIQRMLFAIAAYNAGPAKIAKCRSAAKDLGYDPNKWFNNVEVAAAKLIGRETTQYVANIYKYYVTYRLARELVESRGEAAKKNVPAPRR